MQSLTGLSRNIPPNAVLTSLSLALLLLFPSPELCWAQDSPTLLEGSLCCK